MNNGLAKRIIPCLDLVDCLGFLVLDVRIRIAQGERPVTSEIVRVVAM